MKLVIFALLMSFLSVMTHAHEGVHAAGQMHFGLSHLNYFEICVTVLVAFAWYAWARKKTK